MAVEQMVERGHVDTLGMTPPLRLLELLRVAEQHQVPGRRRHGEHVGQGHLPGFVDEQHVDRLDEFRSCPEPWRAAEHAPTRLAKPTPRHGVVVGFFYPNVGVGRDGVARLVRDRDRAGGRLAGIDEQLTNHFVACRNHTDLAAGLDERRDHPRTGERLAGARRPLDREEAAIEFEYRTDRPRRHGGVVCSLAKRTGFHARGTREEQVIHERVASNVIDTPRRSRSSRFAGVISRSPAPRPR